MPNLKYSETPAVSNIDDTSLFSVSADILGSFQSSHIALSDLRTEILAGQSITLSDTLSNGNTSGGTEIDMESENITSLAEPVNPQDAATKNYVDNSTGLPQDLNSTLSAGNSAGANDIDMNSNDILSVNNIVGGATLGIGATDIGIDAADKLDLIASTSVTVNSPQMDVTGTVTMNGNEITGLDLVPSLPDSATSKQYVDNQVGVSQNLSGVLSVGNSAGIYDIDMSGHSILNVSSLSYSALNITGDNVVSVNSTGVMNFVSPVVSFNMSGGSVNFFNTTFNLGNQPSSNVPLPINPDEFANKEYVDGVLSTSLFENRFPAGNFSSNPWQNGTELNNIGIGTSSVRVCDRFFFERVGNSPPGSCCEVYRVALPVHSPDEAPTNIAMRTESVTVINHAPGEYTGHKFDIIGTDMAGMEGVNAGFIIISFSISASVGAEGTYGLSLSHPNGGGTPFNYVVEVPVSNNTRFLSFSIPTPPIPFGNAISGDSSESMTGRFCLGAGTTFNGTPNQWGSNNFRTTANQANFFDSSGNRLFIENLTVCTSNLNAIISHPLDVAHIDASSVISHCHSYYQKSYLDGVRPLSNLTQNGSIRINSNSSGIPIPANLLLYNHNFDQPFVRNPGLSFYNPANNALNQWGPIAGGGAPATQTIWSGTKGFLVSNTANGGAVGSQYQLHWVFDTGI